MRGAGRYGRGQGLRDGRLSVAAALFGTAVLVAASLAQAVHVHPHRPDQELSCVVCQSPIGPAPTVPAVTPPVMRAVMEPLAIPAVPPPPRAPLSFSPKQSPPSA